MIETWPVITASLPGHFFGGATPPAIVRFQGEQYSVIAWNETWTADFGWQVHVSLMKPGDVESQRIAMQAHAASVMREAFSRGIQL